MIKSAIGSLKVAATSHRAELPQLPPGTQHGPGIAEVPAEEEVESGDVVEEPPLPQRGAEDPRGRFFRSIRMLFRKLRKVFRGLSALSDFPPQW